jgi:hypothetical protein
MDRSSQAEMARIGRQSVKHIRDSRASCDDSDAHVDASHGALARSRALLRKTYFMPFGERR